MKKRLVLIIIIMFFILFLLVNSTYALFEANATGSADVDIGNWRILLNNENIALTESITLNDFTYTTTGHTQSGYFSPGTSCEYVVLIDATNTDVAIDYTLEIDDTSALTNHPNISFRVQNLDTLEEVTGNTFSGFLPMTSNSQSRIFRLKIYLDWENNDEYDLLDNELIGENLEFIINATFSQHIG